MNSQSQGKNPTTIVQSGVRRPKWISRHVKQNVVFVRDESGSMHGQKADDASAASLDLVAELAEPSNKDGFNLAIVDFSSNAKIAHNLETASALKGKVKSLSVGLFGGNTNITAGLESAFSILEKAEKQNEEGICYLRPVVIVFTDGCHNTGCPPRKMARRLKDVADLVTVAFGADTDETLMRALASTPQHFYRCSTGQQLRSFLAAVGTTMTATMATGTHSTQALTMIQH